MPLFEENSQTNNQQSNQANSQTQSNSTGEEKYWSKPNTGLFSLPPQIMKLVPWIPLMLEMTTGQKIPQMSGTIGEIQQGIQAIQMNQMQIINHQQAFNQRLTNLENNATQQLTSLSQQFQSLRLTHTQEKKQIEFNPNPKLENTEQNY